MPLLKKGKYSKQFSSDVEYLEEVESLTVNIATEAGFDESTIDDLSIAITELFNNAIHHGNKGDKSKKVELGFHVRNKKMSVTVRDEGKGFQPDAIKNPLDPENLMADSGRGIYLVKMLMDDVEFNISEKGSEIIITKNI